MAYDLYRKTVLVTGATGGIGTEIVKALYAKGANVVITDLNERDVIKLATNYAPNRIMGATLDVTDLEATKIVAQRAVEKFGQLDIVIANAGITAGAAHTVLSLEPEKYERVLEINLFGVYRTVKACLPYIIQSRGQVLITGSLYSYFNGVANSAYGMSKSAVEMLGRSLRAELAHTGASASVLYPGWISTPMTNVAFEQDNPTSRIIKRAFPGFLGKTIPPSDVAQAVVRGLERRSPRIHSPRRFIPFSLFRGIVAAIGDFILGKDRVFRNGVREIEEQAEEASLAAKSSTTETSRGEHPPLN